MRGSAALVLFLAGCGTYTLVRPADTLPKGKAEVAAGVAVSQIEANTVLHAAVGVTDRVEILGQNEIWNTFGEVRYGFVKQVEDDKPVSFAAGVGGGYAITLVSALTESGDNDTVDGAAATASLAVGHDWGNVTGTLGHRTFWLSGGYLAMSTRAGLRLAVNEHFGFFLEAGGTAHTPTWAFGDGLFLAEGSLGLWIGF